MANDRPPRASGETYFFRDQGQFDLIRARLLPELIERRLATKRLRLWSAGCSTGEEAYSLAILVAALLPERGGWDIRILGSDIDRMALAKARRGIYGQWSFRMAPETLRQRHFRRVGDKWALDERIRRMVTFNELDLIGDPYPDREIRDMDLILCRNVFIYFGADAVATVAAKLAATLNPEGYLVAGHTELIGHRVPGLGSRLFADGVVYQKGGDAPDPCPAPSRTQGRGLSPRAFERGCRAPSAAAGESSCGIVTAKARNPLPAMPDPLAAARTLADRGDYDHAELACHQALAANPLAPEAHFLLAQLSQLKRDFKRAGEWLDKTLYLDPGNVAAHLELAALCERAENLPRALTLRRAALDIVRALPGDAVVDPYETTAAEMARWLAP